MVPLQLLLPDLIPLESLLLKSLLPGCFLSECFLLDISYPTYA